MKLAPEGPRSEGDPEGSRSEGEAVAGFSLENPECEGSFRGTRDKLRN